MSDGKKPLAGSARAIRVYVPDAVADFYEQQAARYNTSVSAAAARPLCALAYGEIRNDFTAPGGADVGRP